MLQSSSRCPKLSLRRGVCLSTIPHGRTEAEKVPTTLWGWGRVGVVVLKMGTCNLRYFSKCKHIVVCYNRSRCTDVSLRWGVCLSTIHHGRTEAEKYQPQCGGGVEWESWLSTWEFGDFAWSDCVSWKGAM